MIRTYANTSSDFLVDLLEDEYAEYEGFQKVRRTQASMKAQPSVATKRKDKRATQAKKRKLKEKYG